MNKCVSGDGRYNGRHDRAAEEGRTVQQNAEPPCHDLFIPI